MLLALFVVLLLRTAWLSDDAYITYRSIDNWLAGLGLRFNPSERVQTFTHPLWLLLHTPWHALSGEVYFTSIALCIVVSTLAVAVLATGVARSHGSAALVLLAASGSKAFVEYSTSGLENPLTHLLLAVFAWALLGGSGPRRLLVLATATGLAAVNRLDTLLLFAPALAGAWHAAGLRRGLRQVLPGLAPLLAWLGFALVYFGFPFPNTAYAKLGTGVSTSALLGQGAHYLLDSLVRDPLTLVVVMISFAALPLARDRRLTLLAMGGALYLGYVVRIGGDFMSGRFLTAPFFLALVVLARTPPPRGRVLRTLPAAVLAPLAASWWVGVAREPAEPSPVAPGIVDAWGIADERAYYFAATGLRNAFGPEPMPRHPWAEAGRALRGRGPTLVLDPNLGFRGYLGGPQVHLIDQYGLADPLIARLPAVHDPRNRPGHHARLVPPGYLEHRARGARSLRDPAVARLDERLRIMTRGPVWSLQRFAEIGRALAEPWLGRGGEALAFYRVPVRTRVDLADVARPMQVGTPGNAPGVRRLHRDAGLAVDLADAPRDYSRLELTVSATGSYVVAFRRGPQIVASFGIDPTGGRPVLEQHEIALDPGVARQAPDEVVVYPTGGVGAADRYSLGHLRLR